MKRRNCNLELRLLPPNTDYSSPQHHHNMMMETGRGSPQEQQQQQQLTIFYDGRICVCDVTELQARAILLLASREMEEKTRTPTASDAISPSLHSQLYSPTGLSMKRSLQRFLQKRKNRMEATSPYHR
ncbi:protein TIFY 5A-like [Vitis riparia]|uniref:protein TIFY 5A-like n=1 Tax=Vitis riparia TaxID=96939 RepID=UPI00155A3C04|nr:protein TIFY 5A-like [Vitis riparia]